MPGELSRKKTNPRFFIGVNVSLVLMGFALALIPCAATLRRAHDHYTLLVGLTAISSFSIFCWLGLLYSSSKRDLNWDDTYRRRDL